MNFMWGGFVLPEAKKEKWGKELFLISRHWILKLQKNPRSFPYLYLLCGFINVPAVFSPPVETHPPCPSLRTLPLCEAPKVYFKLDENKWPNTRCRLELLDLADETVPQAQLCSKHLAHMLLGHVLAPRLVTAASSQSVREWGSSKGWKGENSDGNKKKHEITFIMCTQRSGRGAQDPNF